MSLIGNLLWIFLGGGLIIFLEYGVAGIGLCATIVGIPFGIQCFKIAVLGLLPFGREVVARPSASEPLAIVLDVIWLCVWGVGIVLTHLLLAALLAITIVGIPFAVQHWKLTKLALLPFGKDILDAPRG